MAAIALTFLVCLRGAPNDSYAIENTVLCCIPYKTYTAR